MVIRVTAASTSVSGAPGGTSSSAATSPSTMTSAHSANSAYLFGKCRYRAAAVMPTPAATSSIDAVW